MGEQGQAPAGEAQKSEGARSNGTRSDKKRPNHTTCQNCGAALQGDFCHVCGQRADEPRRAVIGLVQDFFIETLAIDGKLARTLGLLLWRPGRLARFHLDGKRASYTAPFRLYLFTSVFFFFALFWSFNFNGRVNNDDVDDATVVGAAEEEAAAALEDAEAAQAEAGAAVEAARERLPEEIAQEIAASIKEAEAAVAEAEEADSRASEEDDGEQAEYDWADREEFRLDEWDAEDYSGPDWLEPHVRRLYESAQRATDDPRLFFAQTRENLPRAMLLAPVAYAFIFVALYIYRRRFFVYDHFIVSLYMHAALYFYLLLALLLGRIPVVGGLFATAVLAWAWLQPAAVLRQAYDSNWFSVVSKWAISISFYFIILLMIITLGVSYSLYQA